MPEVSVLMTVYNREKFLSAAIESVLKSRFEDFEFILVDDCSTDSSWAIAQHYVNLDPRIRIYKNANNLGDYGNRAKAASLASGEYIKYLDSDDLAYSHTLDVMIESVRQFPDAALALSHSQPEAELPYPMHLTSQQAWHRHFLGRGCLSCGPTGAIIRRSAFEAIGGFRKEWGVLSDIDLWLRLSAQWPVLLLPPGLAWWRRHEEQEFSRGNARYQYLVNGYELTKHTLAAENCPLSLSEQRAALRRAKQNHARRILSLIFRERQPRLFIAALRKANFGPFQVVRGFLPYS